MPTRRVVQRFVSMILDEFIEFPPLPIRGRQHPDIEAKIITAIPAREQRHEEAAGMGNSTWMTKRASEPFPAAISITRVADAAIIIV